MLVIDTLFTLICVDQIRSKPWYTYFYIFGNVSQTNILLLREQLGHAFGLLLWSVSVGIGDVACMLVDSSAPAGRE